MTVILVLLVAVVVVIVIIMLALWSLQRHYAQDLSSYDFTNLVNSFAKCRL